MKKKQGPSRHSSSRKRDKGKGGRLRKALSKVAKGARGAPGHGEGDLDAAMAINPFGGGGPAGGRRRGSERGLGDEYDEEGDWA